MNLIAFLKRLVLKIKENHYTKMETEDLIDEKIKDQIPGSINSSSSVEVKNLNVNQNLTVKNLDLSYDGGGTTGKVKSDLTPYTDDAQNLGSSDKAWKNLYLGSGGLKFRTKIPDPAKPGKVLNAKLFAIDGDGNVQIYFPGYQNHKAITISENNRIVIYNPVTKQKMVSIMQNHFEIFGKQSTNSNEGQIQTFSLNTNLHRFDFSDDTAMLATAGELIIIPDHGAFIENNTTTSHYDRIKLGGVEQTHFDVDADANISEEVIFSYKRAGTSMDDIPDVAITKAGTFYYKGKKLEDYSKLYLHTINMGNAYSGNDILFSFYATRKTVFSSFEEVANYFLDANVGRNNINIAPNPFQVNVISANDGGTNAYPMISATACFKRINGVPVLATSITTEIDGPDLQPVIYHYSHNFVYETDEDAGYFYSSCVEV